MTLPEGLAPAPQEPAEIPAIDNTVEGRLERLESKIDSIGKGQYWMMNQVEMALKGLMASPMGAMIRKGMPRGN
jgi:hypothetical protein